MAGYISGGMAVDYYDGEGSAVVGRRTYTWTFHEWMGPYFYGKRGQELKRQPEERSAVWPLFYKWLKKYKARRKKAKAHEIVKV